MPNAWLAAEPLDVAADVCDPLGEMMSEPRPQPARPYFLAAKETCETETSNPASKMLLVTVIAMSEPPVGINGKKHNNSVWYVNGQIEIVFAEFTSWLKLCG